MKLVEYRKIAKTVEDDLRATLKKHGLNLKPFGARIDERLGIVTMKLECVDANHKAPDGSATTPERELWKEICSLYDLKPEWLDQEFSMGRQTYKVTGLIRGRREKNVQIERVADKKVFIASPDQIVGAFAVAAAKKKVA